MQSLSTVKLQTKQKYINDMYTAFHNNVKKSVLKHEQASTSTCIYTHTILIIVQMH